MMRPLFLLALLAIGACEQATTDPSVVAEYAAALRPTKAHTLPALFSSALQTLQEQRGSEALRPLMADWEARHAEVRAAHAAGDRSAVQGGLKALQNEEVRIVLEVFGPEIVTRVIRDSYLELAGAHVRIYEAERAGANVPVARSTAKEILSLLERANAAAPRSPERALRLAAQAAGLFTTIDDALVDVRRVRSVETLFPIAASRLSVAELTGHARLRREAQLALRDGHRITASEKLAEVRAEEIRIVLRVLGEEAPRDVLREVEAAVQEQQTKLRTMETAGQDVTRLQRMLGSSMDMFKRAQQAQQSGDPATALDLGSHAAGLLNSLRHLTAK